MRTTRSPVRADATFFSTVAGAGILVLLSAVAAGYNLSPINGPF